MEGSVIHWRNSNFQIKHFIAGSCHTADEACRKLREQWEDRDVAVRNSDASKLRSDAKMLRAEAVIADEHADEICKLEARADIIEIEAFADQSRGVLEQGIRERDYIQTLIDEIIPFCKYADLPDYEAAQLAQEDEWFEELKFRAQNYIASGGIPADQIGTMRMHPKWETDILPFISNMSNALNANGEISLGYHSPPLIEQSTADEGTDT